MATVCYSWEGRLGAAWNEHATTRRRCFGDGPSSRSEPPGRQPRPCRNQIWPARKGSFCFPVTPTRRIIGGKPPSLRGIERCPEVLIGNKSGMAKKVGKRNSFPARAQGVDGRRGRGAAKEAIAQGWGSEAASVYIRQRGRRGRGTEISGVKSVTTSAHQPEITF